MPDNLPDFDPKTLWLNQTTETAAMTSKLIDQKSRELHARTRKKLLGTFAAPLVAAIFYAYSMKQFAGLGQQLQLPFIIALAWSLAGLYFLNRGRWSGSPSEEFGLRTGLEFCSREVRRQRDLVRLALLWSFGPIMLAIAAFVIALALVSGSQGGLFPNGLPFLLLLAVWIVAWIVVRFREQRQLQRELDELNTIDKS